MRPLGGCWAGAGRALGMHKTGAGRVQAGRWAGAGRALGGCRAGAGHAQDGCRTGAGRALGGCRANTAILYCYHTVIELLTYINKKLFPIFFRENVRPSVV